MVSTLVLDAGALIALDRDDRRAWALLATAARTGATIIAPTGAIAQAWRDGVRQARLSRALRMCDELALDGTIARAAGTLCGSSSTTDVIDATIALVAHAAPGPTTVVTSDPDDIGTLLDHLGSDARVVVV